MLKLLERAVASVDQRLVVLAPPDRALPDTFTACDFDASRHTTLLRDVQRLRGAVYLQDGAITDDQLTPDGVHETPEDQQAWHLVVLNAAGEPTACAWYREHRGGVQFGRLRLQQCPLAADPDWRDTLWHAVTRDITRAQQDGLSYAEVGGWAVAPESRRTPVPLLLALATYSLARLCGDALSITTATTRHASCEILSRIGGTELEFGGRVLPRYYDPRYQCEMQILRFDSRAPQRRYEGIVSRLEETLSDVTVVARPYWPMMRASRRAPAVPAGVLLTGQRLAREVRPALTVA